MAGAAHKPPEATPFNAAEWSALRPVSRKWVREAATTLAKFGSSLGLNSTNSSKPPSSYPARLKKKPRRAGSGRRPGGQVGHPGHQRPLVPADRVDKINDIFPARCQQCGSDLPQGGQGEREPLRHQVAEIPEIRPTITEHRCHRVACPECGHVNLAKLPAGVPHVCFGPNLRALLVALSGRYRISRREVVEFCCEALGLDVSLGTIQNVCQRVATGLASPVAEVKGRIQAAWVVHLDESGWWQKGGRQWIWVAVTTDAAYFVIAPCRGARVVREILGPDFLGHIVTDRWSAYTVVSALMRQVCWAHLKRDFQRLVDHGGRGRAFGEEGLRLTKSWGRYEKGAMTWEKLQRRMAKVEVAVGQLLEEGMRSADGKVRGFCRELLKLAPALFLFVRVRGVEPTNNRAERTLRPVVLWRKGSFGTMSDAGSRFVERIMTAVMTCRLRGCSVLDYLRELCAAQDAGRPIPSLLQFKARDGPAERPATRSQSA